MQKSKSNRHRARDACSCSYTHGLIPQATAASRSRPAAKIKKAGNMLFCQAIIVISNMLMEQGDRDGGDGPVPPQVRFPCVVTSTLSRFFV